MNFGNYCLLLAVSLGLCQDLLSPFSTGKDGLVSAMEDLDFRNSSSSSSVAVATVVHPSTRRRRDIFHLYNMMTCVTGCDPLRYKGYGCYCGFLGSGAPMDGIDRCCMYHDQCYERAACHFLLVYIVPYKWICHQRRPYCVTGPGRPRNQQLCSLHLCECDRQFAECISRYPCPDRKLTCASNPLRNVG